MAKPHLQGEKNGRAKLTEAKVQEVRAAEGTQQAIADKFSLSRAQVGSIRRLDSWKHLEPPLGQVKE